MESQVRNTQGANGQNDEFTRRCRIIIEGREGQILACIIRNRKATTGNQKVKIG